MKRDPGVNFNSSQYWISRYESNGDSGSGSYGELAKFKASVFNELVKEYRIQSVVDIGCGDGNQIGMFEIEEYLGIDISPKVIKSNSKLFAARDKWRFVILSDLEPERISVDMAISIDVIYHLTEKDVFEIHLHNLFQVASKHVLIYGIDSDISPFKSEYKHMFFREFTPFVETHYPEWKLVNVIENPIYQQVISADNDDLSPAFYLFMKE